MSLAADSAITGDSIFLCLVILCFAIQEVASRMNPRRTDASRIGRHLEKQGATLLSAERLKSSAAERHDVAAHHLIIYRDVHGYFHQAECITDFGRGVYFSNDTVVAPPQETKKDPAARIAELEAENAELRKALASRDG